MTNEEYDALRKIPGCGYFTGNPLRESRDHWKRRAEAAEARAEGLERAIKGRDANTSVLCFACYTCAHEREDTVYCGEKCGRDRHNWQFDEARFAESYD